MTWLALALLGSVVGLDATSFPQVMVSRPLVAAALGGWVVGEPAAGLLVGVVMEALSLVALPVGAARYPEGGTAALGAGAVFAASAQTPAELMLAVGFALAWEQVAGRSVLWMRDRNGTLVAPLAEPARAEDAGVERRHLLAMGLDAVRGSVVTVAGAWVTAVGVTALAPLLPFGVATIEGLLVAAAAAVLGALLPIFGGWSERRFTFLVGLVIGGILVWLR